MAKKRLITLFILAMFHLAPVNAADGRQYLLLFSESRSTDPSQDVGTTEVSGFGLEWLGGHNNESFVFAGISGGKMTSDQDISAYGDPKIGYPIYVHGGITMPAAFSPFFEYGIELGEVIFNETLEGNEANTEHYVAGGVLFRGKAMLIKLYAKEYRLKPYLMPPVDVYVTGIAVGLEF